MLARLAGFFGKGQERSIGGFRINFAGIEATVTDPSILTYLPIARTDWNLAQAESAGRKPLSFAEALEQLDPDQLSNIVLFDSPGTGGAIGNHWRVVTIIPNETVTLQLCNEFGNRDYNEVSPVNLPVNRPFFTGATLLAYEHNGERRPLSFVARLVAQAQEELEQYPNGLRKVEETIYFSDTEGRLQPVGRDPST